MSYPNREHENADKAAQRRALTVLKNIVTDAEIIRRRLEGSTVHPDAADARGIALQAAQLTEHLAILETLREVREWHEADKGGS
jgi:hypothetical protein